jgi:ketosteroid isomerase-like protein
MSQANVEAFTRAIEAYNSRDVDSFVAAFDPEVEWRPLNQAMFGTEEAIYQGHQGVRRFLREVDEAFSEVEIRGLESRDLGERIVVTARLRARGKASEAETESPIGWAVEFKDGRVSRMTDYLDPKAAVNAAGGSSATNRTIGLSGTV